MKNSVSISIIVPVFNTEEYLKECLDSIINQSFDDIEIICVDDASTDLSNNILIQYEQNDSRIVIVTHEQNKGLAAARNSGLAVAKGNYIFFIDSDDFLYGTDALEILHKNAIADNSDEIIGGVLKWNQIKDEYFLDWHERYLSEEIHGKSIINLPQLSANVVAWNKLIKHDLIKKNNIRFNVKLRKHEDNPFSCKIHILSKNITIIPKTTYIYRQAMENSIMSSIKRADAIYRCIYCYDIFNFIEKNQKRHHFRKMYYPMYSRQLINSAEILSKFSPTFREKKELLDEWLKIIKVLPNNLPEIPDQQKYIFSLLIHRDFHSTWKQSLIFANEPNYAKIRKLKKSNERLIKLNSRLNILFKALHSN